MKMNLILSSFAGRARKKEIEIKIQCAIPADFTVSESDLCVLLSNALENALHACVRDQQMLIILCSIRTRI